MTTKVRVKWSNAKSVLGMIRFDVIFPYHYGYKLYLMGTAILAFLSSELQKFFYETGK